MPCRRARQTERGRGQGRRMYRRPARAPDGLRALQCVLRTRVRVIVRAPQWFLLARAVIARSGAGMMRGKRTSQCGDTLYEAQGKTHIVRSNMRAMPGDSKGLARAKNTGHDRARRRSEERRVGKECR